VSLVSTGDFQSGSLGLLVVLCPLSLSESFNRRTLVWTEREWSVNPETFTISAMIPTDLSLRCSYSHIRVPLTSGFVLSIGVRQHYPSVTPPGSGDLNHLCTLWTLTWPDLPPVELASPIRVNPMAAYSGPFRGRIAFAILAVPAAGGPQWPRPASKA